MVSSLSAGVMVIHLGVALGGQLPEAGPLELGSASGEPGGLDIADPVATLDFLFVGSFSLPCEDAADSNDDGDLSITDPIVTLHYLFLGVGVLRAPGVSHAWFDPTPDRLTCKG